MYVKMLFGIKNCYQFIRCINYKKFSNSFLKKARKPITNQSQLAYVTKDN